MMNQTKYAYAVARVRANELSLLSSADIEQLVSAEDYEQVMHRLADNGWGDITDMADYTKYINAYKMKTWDLLQEIMEDIHELDTLVIRNDMQNLKAALKSIISQNTSDELYVQPTVYDTDAITQAVDERKFSDLPEDMRDVAQEAYEILTHTDNGQLADVVIDRKTLEITKKLGKESGSKMLADVAEQICVFANIKIALRCVYTGKSNDFLDMALCECDTLNKGELITATLGGFDELMSTIASAGYSGAVEMLNISTTAFEKWCDDQIMERIMPAKYNAFSVDPLAAYYLAKDAEVKTIRIILSAKLNHLSADVIRERVRLLYV